MKILIAEDEVISRRLLHGILVKWGYEVIETTDGDAAWQMLQSDDSPRLAILDWAMPAMDGIDVCRKLRQRLDSPYTYILLLTAKSGKDDLIEGMEAGADDYLIKPLDIQELKVRLRAGRRILDLQTALLSSQETLRIQASHDALTNLLNRATILERLRQQIARSTREHSAFSVIMADLDHFKQVNDMYGHLAGDAVLREAARRMRMIVGAYDDVGRYGGEEFLIVLPGCDAANAGKLAERIREALSGQAMNTSEGIIPLTLSLGVASSTNGEETDALALVGTADAALYRAKRDGRDRVVIG